MKAGLGGSVEKTIERLAVGGPRPAGSVALTDAMTAVAERQRTLNPNIGVRREATE
jgi:hypothetical protein